MALDIGKIQSPKSAQKPPSKGFNLSYWLNKEISLGSGIFGDTKKENLYSKMNILLTAGIDIRTVLELLAKEQKKAPDKALIKQILDDVIKGKSLSQAFLSSGKFSPFEYYSLQIGEETGKLSEVLTDLTTYFHHKIAQRRKFISAISYPLVVLATALGAVLFMMKFLVPLFADVYKRFGGELPWVTKLVLYISALVSKGLVGFLLVTAISGWMFYRQRDKAWFRSLSAELTMRIPVFGGIARKIYLSRFCNAMALLSSANVPLTEALRMVRQMVAFYPIEATIDTIRDGILQGGSLHESMQQHIIYPDEMISLIKVGEEVNGLDKMFRRLSDQYTADVTHQTEVLNALLEPVLIVFIGVIIGFILIAMYLPIFKLSTQMM